MSASRRGFIKQASSWLLGASASASFGDLLTGCGSDDAAHSDAASSSGNERSAASAEVSMSEKLIATTRHGKVRGRDVDGVTVFKGIPYGADCRRTP